LTSKVEYIFAARPRGATTWHLLQRRMFPQWSKSGDYFSVVMERATGAATTRMTTTTPQQTPTVAIPGECDIQNLATAAADRGETTATTTDDGALGKDDGVQKGIDR
jgi:Tol biopolymer transport system component